MKENRLISQKHFQKLFGVIMLAVFLPFIATAQTDSNAVETRKEPEIISPLVEFSSIQKANNTIDLKAVFKAKVEGTLTKLEGLKIEFFSVADSDSLLGVAITDRSGTAMLNIKGDVLVADTAGKLNFKIVFGGNKIYDAATEELAIKKARLELVPIKEDSILTVQLKLIDLSTGEEMPVAETDLAVFVKRLFNPLKVGEGTTNETGEVSIEIPGDLPGDDKGNITLIAKVQDNEIYGNLETAIVQKWGMPVSNETKKLPRALWSPHPPLWMLITFIVLMGTVWGHYIVIVFELFRLRREH